MATRSPISSLSALPGPAAAPPEHEPPPFLDVRGLSVFYGATPALKNIDLGLREGAITAFIGPSGCGKSTLLRCFNRMNDLIDRARVEGRILIGGQDIYAREVDPIQLRKRVGMVFQRACPFPKSVFENVAYGLRLRGRRERAALEPVVERSLRAAALWDEVKDRLRAPALSLSAGQQQRLCIARALALEPDILLLDEPGSALDPAATTHIEELLLELRRRYTILLVTHNLRQAARVSDDTAFLCLGELVEHDTTARIFTNPSRKQTEDYVTGRFG